MRKSKKQRPLPMYVIFGSLVILQKRLKAGFGRAKINQKLFHERDLFKNAFGANKINYAMHSIIYNPG